MTERKIYTVMVTRTYSVTDTFEIESDTEFGVREHAQQLSADKDYTGKLQLVDVDVDLYSEESV